MLPVDVADPAASGQASGDDARIDVNGVLEATSPVSGKTVKFDTLPLTFGGFTGWGYFHGDLDEVKFYNVALSASVIQTLYTGASPAITVEETAPFTPTIRTPSFAMERFL